MNPPYLFFAYLPTLILLVPLAYFTREDVFIDIMFFVLFVILAAYYVSCLKKAFEIDAGVEFRVFAWLIFSVSLMVMQFGTIYSSYIAGENCKIKINDKESKFRFMRSVGSGILGYEGDQVVFIQNGSFSTMRCD
jgi:hypothetical protein